jgi:hypothetical protein
MNIARNSAALAILLLSIFCGPARADDAARVQYLSDLLADRAITATQGWGYLGVDTMVKATVRVPKPIRHLGELGIDSKAVPSEQPAPKLRIKDKNYAHGLGAHAVSDILIDLSKQYETFQAEVGVQWMGGTSSGSVVFQVFVDGKKAFDSGVMRENDPPQAIKVSVKGADELRLIVGDAGDGITADCADWADARLTADPAAKPGEAAVDIGRFARILSWNPKSMEGTKAIRSDEFPAADIAPYTEIRRSEGEWQVPYRVPVTDGVGCIGLEWDENRLLRREAIEFVPFRMPPPKSVHLQYWTGESAWQGHWETADTAPQKVGNSLVWQIGYSELPQGTQKIRWLFTDAQNLIPVVRLSALTRSRWATAKIRIEPTEAGSEKKTDIDIYNGEFAERGQSAYHRPWNGKDPLVTTVRYAVPRPYKADRTVLRFKTADAAFGVAIEDLLANDCVYVPNANLFVTRQPSPTTPAEYLKKIAGRKSQIEEVRERPDQDFAHVCSVIHSTTQDQYTWVPTLISLACDNRKFLVFRDGRTVFNEYEHADDYPGESDGIHTTAANVGQWQLAPTFGRGQPSRIERHLDGGWLPIPTTTITVGDVSYRQTTMVAPVGEAEAGKPAWFRDRALGVIDYVVKNNANQASDIRLALAIAPQVPNKAIRYREVKEGFVATSGGRLLAFIEKREAASLTWALEPTGVVLSGKLPAGGETACGVYIPGWKVGPDDYAALLKGNTYRPEVERYWKSLLAPAMQIDIPDRFLANIIRASQVNCMLAARNQKRCEYVVPWISSVHFAFPESEANSIMRGMDMTGHGEFARRGLEFYLKEANPAGYITILVQNKVAGISSGYTLVGTGEILWTLGEHYERTRDQQWLRKVAPQVVHICQWVMRQRAKTKRLDAKGEKAPEYGLFPPGVTADWNRFAYRFFNDAQWYRGLELAGRALADIGDPAAPAILADAKAYRDDIVRAYHVMQAKSPVVRLKNGAWAPGDPSLLGCYGNVEDFLPGEDENRSYVYTVEIGANHLVASEVLDRFSNDAEWIIGHLEDVLFLRSSWIPDPNNCDGFDWGGFAKMQPYYCRITEIHAMRDDVKPFIRSYFNPIPALLNFEDLTFWEDMIGNRCASGAWNKTHETGWFLAQTRTMFVTERGDELWLAPFVPSQWMKNGQKVVVRNAPTRFGKVGYVISPNVADGEITAVVTLPKDCTAKKVVLRLRHPEGKPMRSVIVLGKSHADFDVKKETITFVPESRSVTIQARY